MYVIIYNVIYLEYIRGVESTHGLKFRASTQRRKEGNQHFREVVKHESTRDRRWSTPFNTGSTDEFESNTIQARVLATSVVNTIQHGSQYDIQNDRFLWLIEEVN
jgi:hypothetical protein